MSPRSASAPALKSFFHRHRHWHAALVVQQRQREQLHIELAGSFGVARI